jgi:hypothetical protein
MARQRDHIQLERRRRRAARLFEQNVPVSEVAIGQWKRVKWPSLKKKRSGKAS